MTYRSSWDRTLRTRALDPFTGLLLALSLGASAGCRHTGESSAPIALEVVPVRLATAHEERLPLLSRATGTVRGQTTAVLTSKMVGYLEKVTVRAGDRVQKGQLLAVLAAPQALASVHRTKAAVDASTEGQGEALQALEAARSAEKLALASHARVAALVEGRASTPQALDEAEASLANARAQRTMAEARVRAATSRIAEAHAQASEAEATLADTRLLAPFAGRIIERHVDPGALAAPGTPLFVLEAEERLRVEATVEESLGPVLHLGQTAFVEVDPGAPALPVTIDEIVPQIDVASRAFLAKLALPAAGNGLRPGRFVRVSFVAGEEARLVVPSTALSVKGALDRVLVASGDRLRLRMITRGEQQGAWTEVLSGLVPGERVVAVAQPEDRDGLRFTVVPGTDRP